MRPARALFELTLLTPALVAVGSALAVLELACVARDMWRLRSSPIVDDQETPCAFCPAPADFRITGMTYPGTYDVCASCGGEGG